MVVLYKFPCESKPELEQEECWVWDKYICYFYLLNGRKPYQTEDERRAYLKKKSKERYDANIERERREARARYHSKKEFLNEPVKCDCGLMIGRQNLKNHKKNDKHKERMKQLAEGIELDDKPKTKKQPCECGAVVTNLNRHMETPSHTKRMAAKNNVNKK
tara:strand:- start:535 stop:1017 length:483 start_codon:yes stop_codon:yes gene_type:complete